MTASELPPPEWPKSPPAPRPPVEVVHENAEAAASLEAGRVRAIGRLVFDAGQFESARGDFADYEAT